MYLFVFRGVEAESREIDGALPHKGSGIGVGPDHRGLSKRVPLAVVDLEGNFVGPNLHSEGGQRQCSVEEQRGLSARPGGEMVRSKQQVEGFRLAAEDGSQIARQFRI